MSQIVSSIKWICGSLGSWGFLGLRVSQSLLVFRSLVLQVFSSLGLQVSRFLGPQVFGSLVGSLGLWNLWVSISLWVYGSSSDFPVSLYLSFFQAWFTNTNVLIPGKNLNIVKLFIGSPSCSIKSFIMLVIKFINAEKVCKNT